MGAVAVGLLAAPDAVTAQHPVDGIEWMMENLRSRGQPVIPIFDGWFNNADGTHTFCFGYFSLNLDEVVDIPLGPRNKIEPVEFDGQQPTHFQPVPPPPHDYRRRFCSFTVIVPADFPKDRDVVWTLEIPGRGGPLSVPGHMVSESYQMEEIWQASREIYAPVVELEPDGPEALGRAGVTAERRTVAVGRPLELEIDVSRPMGNPAAESWPDVERWYAIWDKHTGPGDVTFAPEHEPGGWLHVNAEEGETGVTATATFSDPGDYMLRLEVIGEPGEGGSYQFHCCWTHMYVPVTVTR